MPTDKNIDNAAPAPEDLGASRPGRALALATHVHRHQARKGNDIPYMSHILGVAALVVEAGGDDDALIAALLHDTIEDGGMPDEIGQLIEHEFGPQVLAIVEALSDAAPKRGEEKPPWAERKIAYIEGVRTASDPRVQMVCLADKFHNLSNTLDDLEREGPAAWGKFNAGPEEQRWYYGTLGEVFASGPMAGTPLERGYQLALDELTAFKDVA